MRRESCWGEPTGCSVSVTFWLFPDSGELRDQEPDQRSQQCLAAFPNVMHELEEAQVNRQLLLGDPAVGTQPRPQQRPEPLNGVDMVLINPIPVVVPRVLARRVADRVMLVPPLTHPSISV